MRSVALRLTTFALVTLLCPRDVPAYTLEESFEKTIPRQDVALLEVDNVNGSIHVSSWDRDSVRIEAVKKVKAASREEAEEWMEKLKIGIERSDNEISVETVHPRRNWGILDLIFGRWTRGRVDYDISVPSDLDLKLRTVNGDVRARMIKGDIKARTTNGGIKAQGIEGDVDAKTTNGGIELYDISGSVRSSTTNGSVRAEITSLEGDCHISTVNGSISVGLPEDASADLDVRTINGRIRVDFPLMGEIGRRSLKGRMGFGGPLLKLRAINGNISIEKSLKCRKVEAKFPEEPARYLGMDEGRWWDGLLRYNRVEGLALGLKLSLRQNMDRAYLEGAYGLARKMWTYRFGGEKGLLSGLSLGAELHDIVDVQGRWSISDEEATALMVLMGEVTRDYFRRQGYGVHISWEIGRAGRLKLGYLSDRHASLSKVAEWSLFNPKEEKRTNPPVDEGWMRSLRISWDRELPEDGHLELEGELAGGGLGGDFDFKLFSAEMLWRREISSGRCLAARLRLGLADGELPSQMKFGLGGIGTLRGYDFKEFTGDGMFLVQVEYRLGDEDKALVPFVDAGCAWPYGKSIELGDVRLDGGIGMVLDGARLNVAVAPPRKPKWILRLSREL